MGARRLNCWPLIEMGEGEFSPLFPCSQDQAYQHKFHLERMTDTLYFFCAKGFYPRQKANNYHVYCPYCGCQMELKIDHNNKQSAPVYGCPNCR